MEAFLKEFDVAALLPQMDTFLGQLRFYLGLFMLAGPLLMLCFGFVYFFRPAKSPREILAYRGYNGGIQAWRYAQRIAGMTWMILGGGLFAAGLVLCLLFAAMNEVTVATITLVFVCVELAAVILAGVFVNRQVRKYFDQDGNPL